MTRIVRQASAAALFCTGLMGLALTVDSVHTGDAFGIAGALVLTAGSFYGAARLTPGGAA